MLIRIRQMVLALCVLLAAVASFADAYNARPKLVVVIVVDQLRGDLLLRYHDQFVPAGFRLLMDSGANFTECYYDYANTHTAPGHTTLFTGAYTNGHGIIGNEWYDSNLGKMVSSVEDEKTQLVGASGTGASPHNELASTIGDELKLATQGKSRVFGFSLKDRAAILPAGHAADAAYWIDPDTGSIVTSTYYMASLPAWVQQFNARKLNESYWGKQVKDASGAVVFDTTRKPNSDFFGTIGGSPFSETYQVEFAEALLDNEHLGTGATADFLEVSFSGFDVVGHRYGPDSPQSREMTMALDRELARLFHYIDQRVGLSNVLIALSADHGIAPLVEQAQKLHEPAIRWTENPQNKMNDFISHSTGKPGKYIAAVNWAEVYINPKAFADAGVTDEQKAEDLAGQALVASQEGVRGFYTKAQLATGAGIPNDEYGRKYMHSYSPQAGWYVIGFGQAFAVGGRSGTNHAMPFSYDAHVPLMFYGAPFQPGTYRTPAEPVDLAPTITSLLGINKPTHAIGRVLTEALRAPAHATWIPVGATRK